MKLSAFKLLLIAPSILLTSCGYGLKEVYEGVPYNSSVFSENYYNVWNDSINPHNASNKITDKKEAKALSTESDLVFTKMSDVNFRECDDKWSSYSYEYDKNRYPEDNSLLRYGPTVKMDALDSSFKYGVASKMFDGQMFCNGDHQRSRIQVEPTNQGENKGFGVLFSKETNDAKYMMMNFKCSVVYEDNQNLSRCYSDLDLTVGLYLKNDTGYTYIPLTYSVDKVPTNSGDYRIDIAERYNNYVCFGFNLKNINTERLVGFSVQYQYKGIYLYNEHTETYLNYDLEDNKLHSMMLYEVSFPNTTWH